MKKIFTSILIFIMGIFLLTGCGGDPVAEEFEKFLNTDMVEINANYEDLKTEIGKWESYDSDAALAASLKDVLLPNIKESLDMLSKIQLTTDEVKTIKDKYKKVLDAYQKSFELMLAGVEAGNESDFNQGLSHIDQALSRLEEYNGALEELAKEKGLTVQY